MVPLQPGVWLIGCEWLSAPETWPSRFWTCTRSQEIVLLVVEPSSASVTVRSYLIWSPNWKKPPSGGPAMLMTGRLLPDTMVTEETPVLASPSVTVNCTSYEPAAKVCAGLASSEVWPSPKFQW